MAGMTKIMNFDEFVDKANKIHGHRYKYDSISYTKATSKVIINCTTHGKFQMVGSMHLAGQKCRKCSIEERLEGSRESRKSNFIEDSTKIHEGKYNYTMVEYVNSKTKVDIQCEECGLIFSQIPGDHVRGIGCPNCAGNKKMTTSEFILKAVRIHGDKYEYNKTIYTKTAGKIIVTCRIHGDFYSTPNMMLDGCGCPKCGLISNSESKKYDTKMFIAKAEAVHRGLYDYSLVNYVESHSKVKILCKKHNTIFEQTPGNHLSGVGCPICNLSKGELKILNYLEKNKIKYEPQYKFRDCRDKYQLPFDFMVENEGVKKCIEFQGGQHYHPVNRFGGNKAFESLVKRDAIKKKYCEDNGIPLLIIDYRETSKIDSILDKFLVDG